jgi:hypothetical protein
LTTAPTPPPSNTCFTTSEVNDVVHRYRGPIANCLDTWHSHLVAVHPGTLLQCLHSSTRWKEPQPRWPSLTNPCYNANAHYLVILARLGYFCLRQVAPRHPRAFALPTEFNRTLVSKPLYVAVSKFGQVRS